MPAGFYQSKLVLLIETLVLTVLPLVILRFFPELLAYRFWVMAAGLIYVSIFFCSQKITLQELGLAPKSWKLGLLENLTVVLKIVPVIFILYLIFPTRWVVPVGVNGVVLGSVWVCAFMYLFISVPLQEILYRSYLINRAQGVLPLKPARIYAALIFMLIHIPFKTPVMTLGTLFLGWYWVGSFIKHRNLLAIYISHVLVGFAYLSLMFFRP